MPNKFVDEPIQKPNLLERAFEPADWGKQMEQDTHQWSEDNLNHPGLHDSPAYAALKGFIGGAHEAAGRVASSFTSPVALASLLGGPIADVAPEGAPMLAKAGHALSTAGNVGFGLQGAGHAIKGFIDEDLPEFASGVGQAILGGLGTKRSLGDFVGVPSAPTPKGTGFQIENSGAVGGGENWKGNQVGTPVRGKPLTKTITGTEPPAAPLPAPAVDPRTSYWDKQGLNPPTAPGRMASKQFELPLEAEPPVSTSVEDSSRIPSYESGSYPTGSALKSQNKEIEVLHGAGNRMRKEELGYGQQIDKTLQSSLGKLLSRAEGTTKDISDLDKGIQQAGQTGSDIRQQVLDDLVSEEKGHNTADTMLGKEAKAAEKAATEAAARKRIADAITQQGLEPGNVSVSESGSIPTESGRARFNQSWKAPSDESEDLETFSSPGPKPTAQAAPEEPLAEPYSGGEGLSVEYGDEPVQPEAPKAPRTPRNPTLKQQAQQESYAALLAKLKGEAGGDAVAPVASPSEPPVTPQGVSGVGPELPEAFKPFVEGAPAPEAPPMAAGPQSPLARLFKSRVDAAGTNYREIKAALAGGEQVPPEGRTIAGKGLRQEAKAAGLSTGKAAPKFTPEPPVGGTAPSSEYAGWQDDLEGGGFPLYNVKGGEFNDSTVTQDTLKDQKIPFEDPPGSDATTVDQLQKAQALKKQGLNQQQIIERLKSEGGSIDPEFLMLLGRMGIGAAAGGVAGGREEHPYLGALLGAGLGAALGKGLSPEASESVGGTLSTGLETANKFHNAALLSPVSVGKKAAGDIGGLLSAAFEQGKFPELGRVLFGGGMNEAVQAGREASQVPTEALTGAENMVSKGPLSWANRTMAGLTAGTKNIMGQMGLSPEQQKYYTLTAEPKYGATKGLMAAQRSSKIIQHLSPFARIMANRMERGWERSPLGAPSAIFSKDAEVAKNAGKLALAGTVVAGTAANLTPKDFAENHPYETGIISAFGGPYGIPIALGMASQTSRLSALPQMARTAFEDTPGLRAVEDFVDSPKNWGRNYLSGYTNITRPIAQALDPIEPDVTQHIYDKALSNVPGLREQLPGKPIKQTYKFIDEPVNPITRK